MTICVVTDRRRADVVDQAQRAVDAGIDLIQIRERDLDALPLCRLVEAVVRLTRGSSTRVVVNDRVDVALACGADGVHLRSDSIPPVAARRLAPPRFLIGRSVHSAEEAAAVVDVDYLIAGTAFPTMSKRGAAPLGVGGLRAIVAAAAVPVLAIGGVDKERFGQVAASGAAGIAAISLFSTGALHTIALEARAAFDSAQARP